MSCLVSCLWPHSCSPNSVTSAKEATTIIAQLQQKRAKLKALFDSAVEITGRFEIEASKPSNDGRQRHLRTCMKAVYLLDFPAVRGVSRRHARWYASGTKWKAIWWEMVNANSLLYVYIWYTEGSHPPFIRDGCFSSLKKLYSKQPNLELTQEFGPTAFRVSSERHRCWMGGGWSCFFPWLEEHSFYVLLWHHNVCLCQGK